ncbi:hypothetical protein C8F04DRAFT_1205159 [Mycena alexandri]|uniref:Uncharacterized protein n=1 Tax=Mycena alexandri TaxID=1745969 RepID=A0AAD6RYQ4_9AGAR|nr:hypothetical protein C8F04DRAFT_1205159 [Mycena alexandri]
MVQTTDDGLQTAGFGFGPDNFHWATQKFSGDMPGSFLGDQEMLESTHAAVGDAHLMGNNERRDSENSNPSGEPRSLSLQKWTMPIGGKTALQAAFIRSFHVMQWDGGGYGEYFRRRVDREEVARQLWPPPSSLACATRATRTAGALGVAGPSSPTVTHAIARQRLILRLPSPVDTATPPPSPSSLFTPMRLPTSMWDENIDFASISTGDYCG